MTAQSLTLPTRKAGRQSQAAKAAYSELYQRFATDLQAIADKVGFKISARGWGYYLEGLNLVNKSQFDIVVKLINDMRKDGTLPADFTAADISRKAECIPRLDYKPNQELDYQFDQIKHFIKKQYRPHLLCDTTGVYIELVVEKKDLVSLYRDICLKYQIPVFNAKGWSDINSRAELVKRCEEKYLEGYRAIILYCGDFDPAGLVIGETFLKNLKDLETALGIDTSFIEFERFGLNYDYIVNNNLIWTDNLVTGSGNDLSSPKHRDHYKSYVQDYLQKYGARKVEANALLRNVDNARELFLNAIKSYIGDTDLQAYTESITDAREKLLELFDQRTGGTL